MYKKVLAALAMAAGVIAGLAVAAKIYEASLLEPEEDDSWDDLDEDWA